MSNASNSGRPHFTTRRGFITAAGFGVVSLYGLWAAYGAAPFGWRALSGEHDASGGHGGHGAHGERSGPAVAEFRRLVERFVESYRLDDGSVRPRATGAAAGDPHAAHHTAAQAVAQASADPIDVYLMAYQWGFTPATLRLERDTRYRFRMMAIDVTHGASIRIGPGSRIVRLRAGSLAELELQFKRSGEYLVYCTSYCGLLHDRMRASLIVA